MPPSPNPAQFQVAPDHVGSQTASRGAACYGWFIAGVGTWFTAIGMQGVLFSWLVVGELQAEAEWVGVAQSAMMAPSVLLLLLGGAVADHHDRRILLILLHLIATLFSVGLVTAVVSGNLSLPVLLIYALAMGSVQAFVMPARDALLSEVAGPNLMRAVTGLALTQWGMQALGALIAGTARWVGTAPALGLHALILLSGVPTLRKLPAAPPRGDIAGWHLRLADIVEGVREVWRSPILPSIFLLVTAVGVLFIGPFLVVLPILVRDYYGGGVAQLALLNMAFPAGTILGSLMLFWRGRVRGKGVAQLLALLFGAGCLGIIALGLPLWGTLAAVCAWGVGAAIFANTGRTIFQEQAPSSHRGRILSVYTLGFMGSAGLIGAPLSGVLVERIGPLATCAVASATMVVVVACVFRLTETTRVK
jgi:MFS family permease